MPKRSRRNPPSSDEDRAWASYSTAFRDGVMPQLLSSAVYLAVYDAPDGDDSIKFATQLGLMLLHNKPIILVTLPDHPLPERLARVADEIVAWEPGHDDLDQLFSDAIQRVRAGLDDPA